ncbi:MAG: helix-turn-helix transcriptional regulator [Solirubrobacterales bacterium]|nr:helix-turn-helix transcriptional regulator [Solirubrobacterales bacterium]
MPDLLTVLQALANDRRLQVLEWLADPRAHFPPQRDGDLVDDGVCVVFIADKLGVAQPTATAHLQVLKRAGLLTSKRVGQWTFYKRDEDAISRAKDLLQLTL